ncbi:hypothetical protein IKG29_02070 [Candidatus Saccharibacteria bacterium]|nr:hypothetical protein [Candidatus Saccharibacteria bacterium]
MSIYVTNDLHGNKELNKVVINSIINTMVASDTLIINGDGAGARGPLMNKLVKIFYEVRRGETDKECLIEALTEIIKERPDIPDSWIYDSVHAGVFRAVIANHYDLFQQCTEKEVFQVLEETLLPLSQAAREKGIDVIYSSGNGEIVLSDFFVEDITKEKILPPEKRFYQKLVKEGYFSRLGIQYVPYAFNLLNKVAIIGTNLLDIDFAQAMELLSRQGLLNGDGKLKAIVVHYPPAISPLGKIFGFWSPNKIDRARINALDKIIQTLQPNNTPIYFGHIHLSPNDPGMAIYPPLLGFHLGNRYSFWVKPGEVIKID